MLKRSSLDQIVTWHGSRRRKPLVLRGARQVGKSTLVEEAASLLKLSLITVNCEKNLFLDSVFKTLDVPSILTELEAVANLGVINSSTILFLDEIQTTPHALQALRYFYEERPDLAVIAAGSLLEFTLSEHQFSMPVGRIQYLHLGPMTFREFTEAIAPDLTRYLDKVDVGASLPKAAHEKLSSLHRRYLYVGGMPEAVQVYQESSSLSEVSEVHREILETYIDDFSKYARTKDLALLQRVFSSIPRVLGQKIKYVSLAKGERAATVRSIIDLLIKAQIVIPVWHSHCTGVPLGADIDDSVFKLVFLDVGLANALCGMPWHDISDMDETTLVNEGGIAEQYVGQELAHLDGRKPQLTYWQREGKSDNAEVDYIKALGNRIVPVEVKAGKSGSLKSLHQFILRKEVSLAVRFDTHQTSTQSITQKVRTKTGSDEVSFDLVSIPLYAVGELLRLSIGV
jgi:predicted AAA+ superfamily ATPase